MTLATSSFRIAALAGKTSVKWTRYDEDVIPLSVAEMDFGTAPSIERALLDAVRAADFGYIDAPGPLATSFARFAADRWGWRVDPTLVRVTTDVSVAIVESIRHGIPVGGTVVINPPVYDAFVELVAEAGARCREVPMILEGTTWRLDLDGLERAFADGADAYLLCSPQNPVGIVFDEPTLDRIASLAARYDVLVISDEVHAPLAHPGVRFVPFLRVAARHGARAICVTSASKGWNIAGLKCAILVAGDRRALEVFDRFPAEVTCRTSILGLTGNVAAFGAVEWLDATVARIVENDGLLARMLAERMPRARYFRPQASYLAWVDLTAADLGPDPAATLLDRAAVAVNAGALYGAAYRGFVRINLACEPEVLEEAVRRIAAATRR